MMTGSDTVYEDYVWLAVVWVLHEYSKLASGVRNYYPMGEYTGDDLENISEVIREVQRCEVEISKFASIVKIDSNSEFLVKMSVVIRQKKLGWPPETRNLYFHAAETYLRWRNGGMTCACEAELNRIVPIARTFLRPMG